MYIRIRRKQGSYIRRIRQINSEAYLQECTQDHTKMPIGYIYTHMHGSKSISLYQLVNKLVYKIVNKTTFFVKFDSKKEIEYFKLILNILRMTKYVTSSITNYQPRKKRKDIDQNFQFKHGLGVNNM